MVYRGSAGFDPSVTMLSNSRLPFVLVVGAALLLAGCKPSGAEQVEVPPVEEMPQQLQEAFADAPQETREMATELAGQISRDTPSAAEGLEAMSYRTDLTAEQRKAVAEAMSAALIELQRAAAAGDQRAQEAMAARAARK